MARPDPWESVVRAAISASPTGFLELPLEQRQLESYQWCIDWMAATDVYSALIISRHRTGLWKGRYGFIDHPRGKYDLHKLDRRIIELIDRLPHAAGVGPPRSLLLLPGALRRPQGERTVLFDPYPFDEPELRVQLSCKRLPSRRYSSVAEFRQAYFKAPNDLLEYHLTSMH